MKSASSIALALSALVLCLSPAQVSARGVCYDPAHNDDVTVATITADFQAIKATKFTGVRTFYTKFGDTDLGSLAIAQGLNVSLGIPFSNADASASQTHIDAALAVAKLHENDDARVLHIFVGNENLASVNAVPAEMVAFINQIKAQAPANVEVGTVQRNTELLDSTRINAVSGLKDLLAICEVVGVNIHPVFTPSTAADKAIDVLKAQWTTLQSETMATTFPGLAAKLAITETGWPTGGSSNGNTGSLAGAQTYYSDFATWSEDDGNLDDARSFYFQMYDQPQRTDGAFEPYFGLVDSTGAVKFSLGTTATQSA